LIQSIRRIDTFVIRKKKGEKRGHKDKNEHRSNRIQENSYMIAIMKAGGSKHSNRKAPLRARV